MSMIDVLLATFDGEKYLPDLLASLERQTHPDWQLIVRDDESTDGTPSLIEDWAARQGDRVRILHDGRSRLGTCANFGAVLEASDAPYFMFCDQDDVWLPDKMTELLRSIRQAEEQRGTETPTLAHSDLIIVDEDLHELHRSSWRYQRLFKASSRHRRERMILHNPIAGCATIGNAALRQAALPIPNEAYMHDWWVVLVAANLGNIVENPVPTMLYRQHGSNTIGAKSWNLSDVASRFVRNPAAAAERTRLVIEKTQRQAAAFAEIFMDRLDPETAELFSGYARLRDVSYWKRRLFFSRWRLWPDNWLRAATLWWFL